MQNTLFKDFGDTLHRIHECEIIAMNNYVAPLTNSSYILPEVKATSLLEADIQKLDAITNVLNSGDFSQLLANVEGISSLGLVYNNFLECADNVSAKFDGIRTNLKNELTSIIEGKDSESCASFVKTVKDPSFASTLCCGKKEMEEVCFTTTGYKQITADDVEKAKSTLEGAKEKIQAFKDRMKANLNKKKETLSNMDKQMETSAKKINSSKKEDCDKICDEAVVVACYIEMSDMVDHAECVALTTQILEETKQAYTILRMLTEHNARNIKDSKIITEAIQVSAMNEFEEFIQNPVLPEISVNEGKIQDALDSMKSKMTASNARFLKKHKEAALASKCDGIVIEKWYLPKDIEKLYKDTMAEIKKEMDPTKMELKELKEKFKDLKGTLLLGYTDSKGTVISAKMLDGKSAGWVKDLAHNTVRHHKVTPADVKEAVKFLENSDNEITKVQQELQRKVNIASWAIYNPQTLGRTRSEAYVKKINTYMQYVIDCVNLNYQKMLLSQLKVKQQQSRVVVLKAARVSSNESVQILEKEFALIESTFEEFEKEWGN